MEPISIVVLSLIGLNIIVSASGPIILSSAFVIKNISESSCLGGKVKIRDKIIK